MYVLGSIRSIPLAKDHHIHHHLSDRTSSFVLNPPRTNQPSESSLFRGKYDRVTGGFQEDRYILVSADLQGDILFWIFGSVCVFRLCSDMYRLPPQTIVTKIFLAEDVSPMQMFVVVATETSDDMHAAAGEKASFESRARKTKTTTITTLLSIQMTDMMENKEHIFIVAHHFREIQKLFQQIDMAFKQIKTEVHDTSDVMAFFPDHCAMYPDDSPSDLHLYYEI
jgi:hypothetical protein